MPSADAADRQGHDAREIGEAAQPPPAEPAIGTDPLISPPDGSVIGLVAAALSLLGRKLGGRVRTTSTQIRERVRGTVGRVRTAVDRRTAGGAKPTVVEPTGVRRMRGTSWRRRVWLASVLAGISGTVAAVAYVLYSLATLPVDGGIPVDPMQRAIVLAATDGQIYATRGAFRGAKLAAGDLPSCLGKALVSIEDRRFYEHVGIDLRGTLRAVVRDVLGGGAIEGGSTITQQLVRITYLSPEKTLRRKVQEALLSLWIEMHLSKDEILLRYLNTAYFGAGSYGADAAAHRYFGKQPKDLNLTECAMLAGLVRAPSQLAPTRNFGGAKERADIVLQAMAATGAITAKQADDARAEPVNLATPPETPPGANYFVDMVAADVRHLPNGAAGDLTLETTLNLELQRLAEGVVERRLANEGPRKNAGQAALVALGIDGAVLAMVGGRDYESSQFNRATLAKRQPGSLFKLFVYLAAFAKGYTPQSQMVDQPVSIADWEPQNASGGFHGRMDLRHAFADSVNTVAAQLGVKVGIPAVIDTAKQLGIRSELVDNPSLALGTSEVDLLEMVRAYGAVAAGKPTLEPFGVRTIRGAHQQVLYTRPPTTTELDAGTARQRDMMRDLLRAVVNEGTGKDARLPHLDVGGKTGTAQNFRDAWFIGFTPDLVVGVWVGNDDNSPMRGVVGGDLPAAIWHDFVERAEPILTPKTAAPADKPGLPAAGAQPLQAKPDATPPPDVLRGSPGIVDTGTLAFGARRVHLEGVQGEGGRMARQMANFMRRREAVCGPARTSSSAAAESDIHDEVRCQIDGQDLATMILSAGGARASEDASPELLAAEEQARSARIGIWRYQR